MTPNKAPRGCGRSGARGMGGVNHCSLHCRLAKFCGLMRRGKYGAVIGQKTRFFVCAQYELPGYGFLFQPITALNFPLLIKPGNFAKRQCKPSG
jgi:hypothetical protein